MLLLETNNKTNACEIREVDFDLPLYEVNEYVCFVDKDVQHEGVITSTSMERICIDGTFYNQYKYRIDYETEISEEQIEYNIDLDSLVEEE